MDITNTHEPARIFGVRRTAIVEIMLGFAALTALDIFMFNGTRFWDVNPHPFWIVVLLIAAQYGTAEGLLASMLAAAFYLVGNIPAMPEDMDYFTYIYSLSVNPMLWLVASWLLGELRQRNIRERDFLRSSLAESQQRENLIADSYRLVKNRKESLEIQVSGQLSSSIEAYRAAKSVETLDPAMAMRGVERLVQSVIGAQKFSLYLLHENKLSATILHGWESDDQFLQELDSFSPLYQAVVGQREMLTIANEQHELALDGQGLLACPVMDVQDSRVIGMLKVEQMDFAALSLATVETFRAVSEWIGTALVNAHYYQSVKTGSIVNPEHNILSYSYFKRQSEYMRTLAKRVGFDVSMLVIRINDATSFSDADRITIARQIGASVKAVLRSIDLAFDYQTAGEEYSILLPATGQSGAVVVRDKIVRHIEQALRGKSGATFNCIVQALHEVR